MKKPCKFSGFSFASGGDTCQAKNSLVVSSQPITSIHDTFYVCCDLCFLATSVSEATVTQFIMRVIFRCVCVLACLEAWVTTRQKKERDPSFLFPNAPARHKLSPLAFLRLLSEHRRVVLARNDRRRSQVAWIFVYFLPNSMEALLHFSQEYQKNPQQFHPFSRCGGFNSIKTLPFAAVLLLSPSRGVERVKKEQSLLPVAIVPRHNVIVLTQFCGTFWQKLGFGFFFSEHFFPDLDSTRLSAGLWGSCWETHHLVSSFEAHFED